MKNPAKKSSVIAGKFSRKRLAAVVSSSLSLMSLSSETFAEYAVINNDVEKIVDSQWDVGTNGTVQVGRDTKGTLTVSAGGHLITRLLSIGRYSGGDGEVNVINGGMITLTNTSYAYPLAVGGEGSSGNGSLGTKGVLNITGAGSQVIINDGIGELSVGSQGAEGLLKITEGGKLTINQGEIYIGSRGTTETKGVVIVDGAGSELYSNGRVLVGTYNDGRLLISNGGVFKTDSYIGIGRTGTTITADSILSVTGAGSVAESVGVTSVGTSGKGTAVVSDQGTLKASQIIIAESSGSVGELAIGSRKGEAATAAGVIETGSIKFGVGQGALVFNHTDDDFELATAISGKGSVEAIGGTTILSGANTYTGITSITEGATIQAGATNTFSAGSTYDLASGGTLNLNNYDQTIGKLTNAGTVILGGVNDGVGTTLTVAGDYIGSNGTLIFNGAFNADDDSITDKLVITGNSSGSTKVRVNNIGGLGAQTINGIEIIEVRGLAEGTFEQDGPIVAGAYDYFLTRGDVDEGTSDQKWYLSSKFVPTPDPGKPPGDDDESGNGGVGNGGSGNGGHSGSSQNFVRPEAGSYLGLLEYNQSAFNHSFHDRQQLVDNQYQSAWARVEYTHDKSKVANGQLDNKTERTLLHFGADVFQQDKLHIGLMGGYAKGDVDTSSNRTGNTSTAKSDGYSVGLYGTWFEQDKTNGGLYVDTYAQYNWFKNKINRKGLAEVSLDRESYTVSAEAGYGFILGKAGNMTWQIEPQVQFIYNSHEKKNNIEANGTRISINDADDFVSRVGVRFQGKSDSIEPFVTLNYWNHSKNAGITMGETQVNSERARNIFEVKAGGQVHLNKNLDLFAQVSSSWGDKSTSSYGGNVGLKLNW